MQWKSTNSFFIKIFTAFWLFIVLLISALILLPQLDSRQLQSTNQADSELLSQQSSHLKELFDKNPRLNSQSILDLLSDNTYTSIFFTDNTGHLINAEAPLKMRQFMLDSRNPAKPLKQINNYKTYFGPQLLTHNHHNVLLYISIPNQKRSLELVEWLLDNPLLLILTGIIISMPICAFFAWNLTLPLRQLRGISTKVARGELDIPFPDITNSDDFTMLSKSMQLMVNSLKNMLNNQQRLLSDISHELRSPLTRLSLASAITKKHTGDTKELQRIDIEVDRMEKMIAEMLNLSQIQLHQAKKEDITLDEFLEDLFLDAEFEAGECNKIFVYPALSKVTINIYPELAYRAIENIIRNAIKYAKHSIWVKIYIAEHIITLSISNDGPLIPETELDHIFRPFYRLTESRDRETGGAGLGLSIAENAILKHGGKIWADNLGNQVTMHLQFPRFN